MSIEKLKGLSLEELERLKVVVEWQMSIAKCWEVIAKKERSIKEINQQIEIIKNKKQWQR